MYCRDLRVRWLSHVLAYIYTNHTDTHAYMKWQNLKEYQHSRWRICLLFGVGLQQRFLKEFSSSRISGDTNETNNRGKTETNGKKHRFVLTKQNNTWCFRVAKLFVCIGDWGITPLEGGIPRSPHNMTWSKGKAKPQLLNPWTRTLYQSS